MAKVKRSSSLVVFRLQPTLDVNSGHATRSSGGYRLTIGVVLYVSTSKDPIDIGMGAVMGDDVSVRIHSYLATKDVGIWDVADCDKEALDI